jgi:two-component system, sensor histidine kinase and response regulator
MPESIISGKSPLSLHALQRKLTLYTMFLGGVLMLIFGITNLFTEVPVFIALMKMGLSVPFFSAYFLIVKNLPHQRVLNVVLVLCYLAIVINFFHNQGSNGPTDYTIFLFTIVITALINGAMKWVWLVLVFFTFAGLYFAEVNDWIDINTEYSSPFGAFLDNVLGFFWILVFWVMGLWILLKSYNAQYQLLVQTKNEKEEANEKLELLNQKKTKLLALLSHDLKSPMASLQLTLELFEMGILNQSNMEILVKNLKRQNIHLSNVLNNTLHWVMTELGDRIDTKETTHIQGLTKDIFDTMQVTASEKNIKLAFQEDGESLILDIEANPIKIILKNLLDNAIKFTNPEEEIRLNLNASRGKLLWEVVNPGEVLSEKVQRDLFSLAVEPTYGTQKEKGTGLGLSLSREIADAIGMKLGYRYESGWHYFSLEKPLL